MRMVLCFGFSRWATFCSLLTCTSFSVAISMFSRSNCNAVEFRSLFCFLKVFELLAPQNSNLIASRFLSGSDRTSETYNLPKDPYRVHIVLDGAAGSLQDPLLHLLLLVLSNNTFAFLSLMSCLSTHVAQLCRLVLQSSSTELLHPFPASGSR